MTSLGTVPSLTSASFYPTERRRCVGPPSVSFFRQYDRGLSLLSNSNTRGLILQDKSIGFRPLRVENDRHGAGSWEEGKRRPNLVMESVRKVFDGMPEPAKTYPWVNIAVHFFRTVLGLVFAVGKYLSVPLLLISSLSEMSYCALERKMVVIPIPFLAGIAVACALKHTFMEVSSALKEDEFPWHLLLICAFFVLIKIPGPYYPHFGRLTIPHFANGGLWSTFWFVFQLSRKLKDTQGL